MSNFFTVYLLFSSLALKGKKKSGQTFQDHSASHGNLASTDDSSLKQSLQWWLQNSDFPATTLSVLSCVQKEESFFLLCIYLVQTLLTLFNGLQLITGLVSFDAQMFPDLTIRSLLADSYTLLTGPYHFLAWDFFTFWHLTTYSKIILYLHGPSPETGNFSRSSDSFSFPQIYSILRWDCFVLLLMTDWDSSLYLFHIINRDFLKIRYSVWERHELWERDLSLNTGSITC